MAKLEISIENFDKVCASIATRGRNLEATIQNATLIAVDYWHAHNHNPRYLTQLGRTVEATRGLSFSRWLKYVEYHCPVVWSKVKGELKFANDADGWESISDTRLAAMLDVSWVDWKSPQDEKPEFDLDKWALTQARKLRKEGVDVAAAEKALEIALEEIAKKMAKTAGEATAK